MHHQTLQKHPACGRTHAFCCKKSINDEGGQATWQGAMFVKILRSAAMKTHWHNCCSSSHQQSSLVYHIRKPQTDASYLKYSLTEIILSKLWLHVSSQLSPESCTNRTTRTTTVCSYWRIFRVYSDHWSEEQGGEQEPCVVSCIRSPKVTH